MWCLPTENRVTLQGGVPASPPDKFGFTADGQDRRSSMLHHELEDEMRHEIQMEERTIKTTREFLGITLVILLLSVIANFGFTW